MDVGSPLYFEFVPLCLPSRSLKQLSRTRSSQSSEPWRPRDVPRAGRPPRRRAARGRPSVRPSAARRGAGRSAVRAGASPRRAATMPEVFVQFSLRCCDVSKIGAGCVCVCVCVCEMCFLCARFVCCVGLGGLGPFCEYIILNPCLCVVVFRGPLKFCEVRAASRMSKPISPWTPTCGAELFKRAIPGLSSPSVRGWGVWVRPVDLVRRRPCKDS